MSDRHVKKAIDAAGTSISSAINAQTKVIQALVDYLCPAMKEAKMGSAEEDKIDDSAGVYKLDEHTKEQLKEEWKRLGYPPELAQYIR